MRNVMVKQLTAEKTGGLQKIISWWMKGRYWSEVTDRDQNPSLPSICPMTAIEPPQNIKFQLKMIVVLTISCFSPEFNVILLK